MKNTRHVEQRNAMWLSRKNNSYRSRHSKKIIKDINYLIHNNE